MSEKDKYSDLSHRIEAAESHLQAETHHGDAEASKVIGGRNVGLDFLGSVVVCGIVGILADRAFNTLPWFTLGMIFLGFAIGIAGVWRALQKPADKR